MIHSYVLLSHLCIPNISWKYVGPVAKYGGEMSLKCWRSVGSALYQKMRTPKLYVILKKIITKKMIYTEIGTKSNSLFSSYEHLKSAPPPFSQLNFT